MVRFYFILLFIYSVIIQLFFQLLHLFSQVISLFQSVVSLFCYTTHKSQESRVFLLYTDSLLLFVFPALPHCPHFQSIDLIKFVSILYFRSECCMNFQFYFYFYLLQFTIKYWTVQFEHLPLRFRDKQHETKCAAIRIQVHYYVFHSFVQIRAP